MTEADLVILTADWKTYRTQLASIRFKVFVEEQQVPEEMEIDEEDSHALHFLVMNNKNHQPIATARLLANGHIGRMAVLKEYRNQGVGSQLLSAIISNAHEHNINEVFLNAQTSALGFYQKNGFMMHGEQFMDAGIPHIQMTRNL